MSRRVFNPAQRWNSPLMRCRYIEVGFSIDEMSIEVAFSFDKMQLKVGFSIDEMQLKVGFLLMRCS